MEEILNEIRELRREIAELRAEVDRIPKGYPRSEYVYDECDEEIEDDE